MRSIRQGVRVALSGAILLLSVMIPTTRPALAQTSPNSCIDIASDSNGVGQVLLQIPPDGTIGIVYVHPLKTILERELHNLTITNLSVIDHSMSAAAVTATGRNYYPSSKPFTNLVKDRCQYILVGPYLSDNRANPNDYVSKLASFIQTLTEDDPGVTIFVLSFYQPIPASFVTSDMEYTGFSADHIAALNTRLAQACESGDMIGHLNKVVCISTQPILDGSDYVLTHVTKSQYEGMLEKPSAFTDTILSYYNKNPQGALIGDGYHLTLTGRMRLMAYVARLVARDEAF